MPGARPRYLLDTQVAVMCYLDGVESLPSKVKKLLDPLSICYISPVSLAEIGIKNSVGKLRMTQGEMRQMIRDLSLIELSFTIEHAERMADLPLHHKDPFDRMLIATALTEEIPIVSSDLPFRRYAGLKVIW